MIVDSSALVAILGSEPEAEDLENSLLDAPLRCISAVTYVETAIVVDSRRDAVLSRRLDEFLRETEIDIEPVTSEQARLAREAYRDFGKGRHRAGLNFGDCFTYALAKLTGEPVLFKGNDFSRTDIGIAVSQAL